PAFQQQPQLLRQVDLFLGQCYQNLDEPGRQLAAFSRVVAKEPTSEAALLGMLTAYWALGRTEDALAQAQQLMSLPRPPDQGWLDIARVFLQRHDPRDAKKAEAIAFVLQKAAEKQPGSVDVLLTQFDAVAPRDDLDREALDKLAKALAEAKNQQPKRAEVWVALAALAERRGDAVAALQFLTEGSSKENAGDVLPLRLARAQFWASRSKAQA